MITKTTHRKSTQSIEKKVVTKDLKMNIINHMDISSHIPPYAYIAVPVMASLRTHCVILAYTDMVNQPTVSFLSR